MQSIRMRKKRFLIFALAVTVVLAAATCFVAVNAVRQMNKLGEINSEYDALEQRYNEMLRDEQRLEFMIEYSGSKEYLEQQARERFGYVLPDDIIFDTSGYDKVIKPIILHRQAIFIVTGWRC